MLVTFITVVYASAILTRLYENSKQLQLVDVIINQKTNCVKILKSTIIWIKTNQSCIQTTVCQWRFKMSFHVSYFNTNKCYTPRTIVPWRGINIKMKSIGSSHIERMRKQLCLLTCRKNVMSMSCMYSFKNNIAVLK